MTRSRSLSALALLLAPCLFAALSQEPSPATFTGCAMPLAGHPDFLTLCEPHTCSLMRGKVDPHWAGHTVTLRGTLHPATSTQPRTIEVVHLTTLGEACKAVCKPSIPGRGVGPENNPDGEGGTRGVDDRKP